LNGIFRAVPTLETASIWPEAATVLAPALELAARFYSADDIQSRLADERMQLFVFELDGRVRMACVTQVENYPRGKALSIVVVGGEGFGLWQDWLRDLAVCAQQMGCGILRSVGRDGWERAAGFKKMGTAYLMEIEDVR